MSRKLLLIFFGISVNFPGLSITPRNTDIYGTREIEWSPNGELIAIAQTDGLITIRTASGTIQSTIQGDPRNSMALAWRSDSTQLATGGDDPEIKIWDISTGNLVKSIPAIPDGVFVIAWQPNGSYILASGFDTFGVWDVESGQPITDPTGVTLTDIQWNPSGTEFAFSATRIGTAKIEGNEIQGTLFEDDETRGYYYSVEYNSDGRIILAAGGLDGTVSLWDALTGRRISVLLDTDEVIQDARFMNDSESQVGAVSDRGNIYIIDLTTSAVETLSYDSINLWSIAPNPASSSLFAIGGVIDKASLSTSQQGIQTINQSTQFFHLITHHDS